jgi:hypothetical protein
MTQSVQGAWDALYTALQGLFPGSAGWFVSAGDPGEYQPDLIVAMMGIRSPITRPTMGTNRSRDKRIEIDVVVSVYMHGGIEAQQPAMQAAWSAADQIEAYIRTSPNEKLGGACYDAFVEQGAMTPSVSYERVDGIEGLVPAGRIADIALTVQARIRI